MDTEDSIMAIVHVQFADETETTIVSYFGSPQDPAIYPNYADIDTSDPRWHAYYNSLPDWLQPWLPTPD